MYHMGSYVAPMFSGPDDLADRVDSYACVITGLLTTILRIISRHLIHSLVMEAYLVEETKPLTSFARRTTLVSSSSPMSSSGTAILVRGSSIRTNDSPVCARLRDWFGRDFLTKTHGPAGAAAFSPSVSLIAER